MQVSCQPMHVVRSARRPWQLLAHEILFTLTGRAEPVFKLQIMGMKVERGTGSI